MFTVKVTNAGPVADRIRNYANKATDFNEYYTKLGESLGEAEAEWFASNGGGQWAPLTYETLRIKESIGAPFDTLIRTYELYNDLTQDPLAQTSAYTAVFGTDVPHAIFHAEGEGLLYRPPLIPTEEVAIISDRILNEQIGYP